MGTVLVVDDDDDIRELVALRLGMDGHDVSAFGDPREALACAAITPFDVALVDWTMPDMDGGQFCARLREVPGLDRVPILVMTAHADPRARDRALEAGANEYIAKPFSLQELAASVRRLMTPTQ